MVAKAKEEERLAAAGVGVDGGIVKKDLQFLDLAVLREYLQLYFNFYSKETLEGGGGGEGQKEGKIEGKDEAEENGCDVEKGEVDVSEVGGRMIEFNPHTTSSNISIQTHHPPDPPPTCPPSTTLPPDSSEVMNVKVEEEGIRVKTEVYDFPDESTSSTGKHTQITTTPTCPTILSSCYGTSVKTSIKSEETVSSFPSNPPPPPPIVMPSPVIHSPPRRPPLDGTIPPPLILTPPQRPYQPPHQIEPPGTARFSSFPSAPPYYPLPPPAFSSSTSSPPPPPPPCAGEVFGRPCTFLPFPFDFECCVDDFVFMCYFCGNDFLPHLPSVSIHKGSIDMMMELYMQVQSYTGRNGRTREREGGRRGRKENRNP